MGPAGRRAPAPESLTRLRSTVLARNSWDDRAGPGIGYFDHSYYCAAKFELERRRKQEKHEPRQIEIAATDNDLDITKKLLQHGFRRASSKYHSDHGGNDAIQRRINSANACAKKKLLS